YYALYFYCVDLYRYSFFFFFFFNDTATTEIYTLSLHDALPISRDRYGPGLGEQMLLARRLCEAGVGFVTLHYGGWDMHGDIANRDRKSTRLNPVTIRSRMPSSA